MKRPLLLQLHLYTLCSYLVTSSQQTGGLQQSLGFVVAGVWSEEPYKRFIVLSTSVEAPLGAPLEPSSPLVQVTELISDQGLFSMLNQGLLLSAPLGKLSHC